MNWQQNKLEISLVFCAVLGVTSFLSMFRLSHNGSKSKLGEINYEMPRAKSSLTAEFDLTNREILRHYLNPNAKNNKNQHSLTKKLDKTTQLVAKKTAQTKASAKAESQKNRQVTMNVIEKDNKDSLGEIEGLEEPLNQPVMPMSVKKNSPQSTVTKQENKEEERDWKKLFSTGGSPSLMAEMVQAYQLQKVDDQTFFEIIKDLIVSQNTQNQNVGLSGLQSLGTFKSYAAAIQFESLPEVQKSTTVQKSLESYLLGFNQASKLAVLDQGLKSKDQEIVIKTVQIISEGFSKVKAGQNSVSSSTANRSGRGLSTLTTSSYQRFITTLKQLQNNQDQEVSQSASSLLSQIQTVNVAQNP